MNLALFGAGRIGKIHANNVAVLANVNLKYIIDVDHASAETLAKRYQAKSVDTTTALHDHSINGVIIASPTNTHANLIVQAALANKAIFCEKPIDLSIERVKECLQIIQQQDALCVIGFNRRFDPQFTQLKQAINQGKVGQIQQICITSRDPSPPPIEYITHSGGIFRDMMIHDLDMARWLLDEEPCEVYANASCIIDPALGDQGDVDSAMVILKTPSGKLCQISNSRATTYGYDQRIEVLGNRGMLQANNNTATNLCFSGDTGVIHEKPLHFFLERYADAYRLELAHFVHALQEKNISSTPNAYDGLQALKLANAALISLKKNVAVKL
ncbi:inositol 2-dehydrogenase [Zooshikella sp. WH53]|uniref:Inositol 2-dehydrogenase n=1 Tax=Zooshikella harenae TaxID=2827238 RepID=A0ABS5ZAU1_9GAMM|nr:inositol 2-dehydrogenase [Zooshikella harenae]